MKGLTATLSVLLIFSILLSLSLVISTKSLEFKETFEKKPNNNLVERFHSTFRERDKVMRGFKAEHTAQALSNGFKTYYNFIRKHQVLMG